MGFWAKPNGFGVWEGVGGREAFLEPVFLPGTAAPSVLQGRCSAVSDFIGRCEGKFMKFPPKFKLSTWAIWSAFTAKISNSSTKQMCAESGFCALQEVGKIHFARQVLVAGGYYPTLNNKWWDGYQSQKVVIMEDVDAVKFLPTTLDLGLGEAQWFGVWEGRGGGKAVFLPLATPSVLQILRLAALGQFWAHSPPKSQIHRPSRCARSLDFCALQESARSTLPAKCW